jgi:hypothetical protein
MVKGNCIPQGHFTSIAASNIPFSPNPIGQIPFQYNCQRATDEELQTKRKLLLNSTKKINKRVKERPLPVSVSK